jgi:hypothetical protein
VAEQVQLDPSVCLRVLRDYLFIDSARLRFAIVSAVALMASGGCKDKTPHADPAAGSSTTAPAPKGSAASTPPPSLPAEVVANVPAEPMSIEDARAALPKLEGTLILDLKQTTDKRQVHGTWCIDGTGADDVAKNVGRSMAEAGYSGLSIRGDARKAGVSGDRGGIRLSMVVAASGAANCAAPQHYFASATIFRP